MEPLYLILIILIINSLLLTSTYFRVKKNISKSIVKEVESCTDDILIYPEVASIRGEIDNKKLKFDGIVYLTDKNIIVHYLTKKNMLTISLKEIKNIDHLDNFMDSTRKGKKVCVLKLKNKNILGLFVTDSKLWEKKIKASKKK